MLNDRKRTKHIQTTSQKRYDVLLKSLKLECLSDKCDPFSINKNNSKHEHIISCFTVASKLLILDVNMLEFSCH